MGVGIRGVVVIVGVSVIADAIEVVVLPLGRIEWEHVVDVIGPVTVVIGIDAIATVVSVEVIGDTERGVRIGLAVRLVGIRPAILVVIKVSVVAHTIAVIVVPLARVQREDVADIWD